MVGAELLNIGKLCGLYAWTLFHRRYSSTLQLSPSPLCHRGDGENPINKKWAKRSCLDARLHANPHRPALQSFPCKCQITHQQGRKEEIRLKIISHRMDSCLTGFFFLLIYG